MKLNIGGEQKKEGWKILNIQKKDGVDFIGDISDLSQFSENSVEEIYASHVVEHVAQKNVDRTLKGIGGIVYEAWINAVEDIENWRIKAWAILGSKPWLAEYFHMDNVPKN